MTETTQTPAPTLAQLLAAQLAALAAAEESLVALDNAKSAYRAAIDTLDKATAAYVTRRNAQPE